MYLNTFRYFSADFWCKLCLTMSEFERWWITAFNQNYFVSFWWWSSLHNKMPNPPYKSLRIHLYLKPCSPLVILVFWGFWVGEKYQLRKYQTQPGLHFRVFFLDSASVLQIWEMGPSSRQRKLQGWSVPLSLVLKMQQDSLLGQKCNKISSLLQIPKP